MNVISKEVELPGGFILGAAGAPSRIVGMNAEVNPFHPHQASLNYFHLELSLRGVAGAPDILKAQHILLEAEE